MTLERHLTVQQASDESGFPLRVIYDAVERKEIRHVRSGKGRNSRIRIPVSAIVEWLASRTVHPEDVQEVPVTAVSSRPSRPRLQTSSVADMLPKGYRPRFSVQ